jgi:sorting nexin-29
MEKVDKRGMVFTKLSQICAYADDVTILAKTENELKRVYQKLEAAANELGLYTNEVKTKYMSITNKQGRLHSNSIEIGSKRFEKVEKCKLLGMVIYSKNNMIEIIQDRIQAGNKAYYTNQKMLKNRYINRGAKMQIYKTLIRPVVTYGYEVWTMKKEDENIL